MKDEQDWTQEDELDALGFQIEADPPGPLDDEDIAFLDAFEDFLREEQDDIPKT